MKYCYRGFTDRSKTVKTTMVKDCRPMEHRGQLIVLRFAGLRPKFSKPCLFERKGWRAHLVSNSDV